MAKRSDAEWIALLNDSGVPCGSMQDVAEMIVHEQARALGLLQKIQDSAMKLTGLPGEL